VLFECIEPGSGVSLGGRFIEIILSTKRGELCLAGRGFDSSRRRESRRWIASE
jgi:hypothetical protein